jgi:hypothetical protein
MCQWPHPRRQRVRIPLSPQPGRSQTGLRPLHLARYLALDTQKWNIAPAGGGFFKIVNSGTGLAIEAASGATVDLAAYTGSDGQLWRLEQYPSSGYRIRNKASGLSLMPAGDSGLAAAQFDPDDTHLWNITTP